MSKPLLCHVGLLDVAYYKNGLDENILGIRRLHFIISLPNGMSMCHYKMTKPTMIVAKLGQFLENPPPGFAVETRSTSYVVKSDPDSCLVLIDDFESCKGKIVFQSSMGRKVKMGNLFDYSNVRKSLLSKRIYMLVTLCEEKKKATEPLKVLMHYVVSIDGSDPFIKWQMERGLDRTISSVAGESYRVDIDINEELQKWSERTAIPTASLWRNTCFTLKYYSDALFDFPHWFGFSKRMFKLKLT